MATKYENGKKILCCTGFAVQKVNEVFWLFASADGDDLDQTLADNLVTAAQDFIGKASAAIYAQGEDGDIQIPVPEGANNCARVLTHLGAVSDAMGRLIGFQVELPEQGFIDALTDAEEAILAG